MAGSFRDDSPDPTFQILSGPFPNPAVAMKYIQHSHYWTRDPTMTQKYSSLASFLVCFLSVVLIILKLIKTFMHFLGEVSSQVGIASQTKRPHSDYVSVQDHKIAASSLICWNCVCVCVFLLPVCRTPPSVTKRPQQRPPKGSNWEVKFIDSVVGVRSLTLRSPRSPEVF